MCVWARLIAGGSNTTMARPQQDQLAGTGFFCPLFFRWGHHGYIAVPSAQDVLCRAKVYAVPTPSAACRERWDVVRRGSRRVGVRGLLVHRYVQLVMRMPEWRIWRPVSPTTAAKLQEPSAVELACNWCTRHVSHRAIFSPKRALEARAAAHCRPLYFRRPLTAPQPLSLMCFSGSPIAVRSTSPLQHPHRSCGMANVQVFCRGALFPGREQSHQVHIRIYSTTFE